MTTGNEILIAFVIGMLVGGIIKCAMDEIMKNKEEYKKRMKMALTEKECLKIGGHCWKEYLANDVLDEKGKITDMRNLVHYPNGEPRFRICKHCKKKQRYTQSWEDL